jgi:hypothetical protein
MNIKSTSFNIVITHPVFFKDNTGTVVKTYIAGDVVKASADTYFVTSMGGIYHDEARRVGPEEMLTYEHLGGNRFRQYAKDALPVWATVVRVEGG